LVIAQQRSDMSQDIPGAPATASTLEPEPYTVSRNAASQRKRTALMASSDAAQQRGQPLQLSGLQTAVLERLKKLLNTEEDSVVITNAQARDGPIVHVTEAWSRMCGCSPEHAVGKNPRMTQGEGSDRETIRMMGHALTQQKACKVRLINYRSLPDGSTIDSNSAFWNCITVRAWTCLVCHCKHI